MEEKKEFLGKKVFIQTVVGYYTGEVVEDTKKYLRLGTAAWIADTGRFAQAMETANFNEVEPFFRDVWLFKNSFIAITEINELPTQQK